MTTHSGIPMLSDGNQFSASIEVASKLRSLLNLKSVHVIPAGLTKWEGWHKSGHEDDSKTHPFSSLIGQLAAPYVAYELANSLISKLKRQRTTRAFRIGVASGSTVRGLVDAFSLPEGIYPSGVLDGVEIEIWPLAIGPSPETVYSAGYIADTLSSRFGHLKCKFKSISEKARVADGLTIAMQQQIRLARDKSPLDRTIWKDDLEKQKSHLCFDWVLTGIGTTGLGQNLAHVKEWFGGHPPEELKNSVGDICSRFFNRDGDELIKNEGDKIVAISFDWLKYLASNDLSGRRVVAVAGGEDKYEPFKTLVRRCIPKLNKDVRKLFNCLVTDEISARQLISDFESELYNLERETKLKR